MRQLTLIKEKKYSKRKVTRAIGLRGANHVIMKTDRHVLRKNTARIRHLIRETQERFSIKIRAISVMSSHIHLIIKVSNRKQFADSLRFLSGMIALKVAKAKLWSKRAWSRPLKWGKDMGQAKLYVWRNAFKADCFSMSDTAYIIDGVLQL